MKALCIILLVLALILLLLIAKIRIRIMMSTGDDNEIILKYLFFKVKLLPKTFTKDIGEEASKKNKGKKTKRTDKNKHLRNLIDRKDDAKDGIFSLVRYIIDHALTVEELNISASFGLFDAMQTGILTGALNAFVYNIIGILDRNTKLKKWDVNLTPDFDNAVFKGGIYCVLRTTPMHLLAFSTILLRAIFKIFIIRGGR